jgi:hypothetical protein
MPARPVTSSVPSMSQKIARVGSLIGGAIGEGWRLELKWHQGASASLDTLTGLNSG